jgi:hypothetical protein
MVSPFVEFECFMAIGGSKDRQREKKFRVLSIRGHGYGLLEKKTPAKFEILA